MKKILKLLQIILLIEIIFFVNKNVVNAKNIKIDDIRLQDVFKNNTIIEYNQNFDVCHLLKEIEGNEYCSGGYYDYPIDVYYYNESDELIKTEKFLGPYNEEIEDYVDSNIVINNDYTEYWKLETLILDYEDLGLKLVPYTYKEPEFSLSCDSSNTNKISRCQLKIKITNRFDNVKFKINSEQNEIFEVKVGDLFENLEINEGVYSLSAKPVLIETRTANEFTIITFKVKISEEKEIQNITKITNLEYKDIANENTINEILPPQSDDTLIENPETGSNISLFVYSIFVISISVSLFLIITRKEQVKL